MNRSTLKPIRLERTQIYLHPLEKGIVKSLAEKSGRSKSSVIRQAIIDYGKRQNADFTKGSDVESVIKFFAELSRGTEKMNIPSDVSERHDYYIYGEGSELSKSV